MCITFTTYTKPYHKPNQQCYKSKHVIKIYFLKQPCHFSLILQVFFNSLTLYVMLYRVSYWASLLHQKSHIELVLWCRLQNVFVYKSCTMVKSFEFSLHFYSALFFTVSVITGTSICSFYFSAKKWKIKYFHLYARHVSWWLKVLSNIRASTA